MNTAVTYIRRILIAINNHGIADRLNGVSRAFCVTPFAYIYAYPYSINGGYLYHKVNQSNDLFPLLLLTQNDLVSEHIFNQRAHTHTHAHPHPKKNTNK